MFPQLSFHLDDELHLNEQQVKRVLLIIGLFSEKTYVPGEFLINNVGLSNLYKHDKHGRKLIEYLLGDGIIVPVMGDKTPKLSDVYKYQVQSGTFGIPDNTELAKSLDEICRYPHYYSIDDRQTCFSERVSRLLDSDNRLEAFGLRGFKRVIQRTMAEENEVFGRISRSSFYRMAEHQDYKSIETKLRLVADLIKDLSYCDLLDAQPSTPRNIGGYLSLVEDEVLFGESAEMRNILAALNEPELKPNDSYVSNFLLHNIYADKLTADDVAKLRGLPSFRPFIYCISGEVGSTNPTKPAMEYLSEADDIIGISIRNTKSLADFWEAKTRLRWIKLGEHSLCSMSLLSANSLISYNPKLGVALWALEYLALSFARKSQERKLSAVRSIKYCPVSE